MPELPKKPIKAKEKINAQEQVMAALAEKTSLNMWQIKQEKNLFYSSVHKAINNLALDDWVQLVNTEKSKKGAMTSIFSLTFTGFTKYLSTLSWRLDSTYNERIRPQHPTMRMDKEERDKLLRIIETQGKLHSYALFEEVRWLVVHFGPLVLDHFVDSARSIIRSPSFPMTQMEFTEYFQKEIGRDLGIKKQDLMEKRIQKRPSSGESEDFELMTEFTTRFSNSFAMDLHLKGELQNEKLQKLFEKTAKKIYDSKVRPTERMAETFACNQKIEDSENVEQ